MKLSKLALYSACIFILSVLTQPVLAADSQTEKATPYQSSFDDYKPLTNENLADWKAINSPSNVGGHSMHGMQMSPEQMTNMPSEKGSPADKSMPAMEGMNHGDMKAMDHSQMKHDQMMAPMEGMDHSKMPSMSHDEMQAMSKHEEPAMQHKDHAAMQGMNHDEKMTGDSAMPAMDSMDHSKMADMEHGHIEPKPEATTSNEMTQHEPSEMMMATTKSAADNASQNGHWQIIPNFHPMVVHFPIALTLIAFLLSLAAYVRRNHPTSSQFAAAGHFTLWLAALGAATAVLFGWLAYNSVNHDDAGHVAMLLHRAWAVPTAIGLVLLASWDAWKHRVHELMSVPALILLFVLAETVAVTGWLGGEVVYRHGIGVLSLPASEGIGHSHHHEHAGTEANNHAHGAAEAEPGEHTEHHHDDEKGESHEH